MELSLMRVLDYWAGVPLCHFFGMLWRVRDRVFSVSPPGDPRRILLIKSWGVGNIVILLPVLKAIREKFPRAEITFLTLRQNRGILEGSPYVDGILLLDVEKGKRFLKSAMNLVYHLRRNRYDWVLDFDQFSRTTAILTALTGAPLRVGLDTARQHRGSVFSEKVPYNDFQHTALTFADVARAAGVQCDPSPIPIPLAAQDQAAAEAFLRENGVGEEDLLVGMHIGCGDNFPGKRWPVANFAQVAMQLIQEYGAKIVFTGTTAEQPLIELAQELMREKGTISSAGKLTLKGLCAVIQRCRFFLSNDTAPIHIASAMGTPVVGFYGPATPRLYGPRGAQSLVFYKGFSCSPCLTNFNAKSSRCTDPRCMTSIAVEEVLGGIRETFPRDRRRSQTGSPAQVPERGEGSPAPDGSPPTPRRKAIEPGKAGGTQESLFP